ncbi:hypothetical protein [Marinobacter alkaliphilus]|uniref:SMODS and SLOG-associating 2TM effector domain-containing protein n=1 Tax=Marinobacter alkaliphilus TaxID=254719 RepID=A0ABZ3EAN9_9GAMM
MVRLKPVFQWFGWLSVAALIIVSADWVSVPGWLSSAADLMALVGVGLLLVSTEFDGWVDRSGSVRESLKYITRELGRLLDILDEDADSFEALSAETRDRLASEARCLSDLLVRAHSAELVSAADFRKPNDQFRALVNDGI